jgi:hypothetical protein
VSLESGVGRAWRWGGLSLGYPVSAANLYCRFVQPMLARMMPFRCDSVSQDGTGICSHGDRPLGGFGIGALRYNRTKIQVWIQVWIRVRFRVRIEART